MPQFSVFMYSIQHRELKFSQIEVKFECLDMHLRLVCAKILCTLDFGTPTTFLGLRLMICTRWCQGTLYCKFGCVVADLYYLRYNFWRSLLQYTHVCCWDYKTCHSGSDKLLSAAISDNNSGHASREPEERGLLGHLQYHCWQQSSDSGICTVQIERVQCTRPRITANV